MRLEARGSARAARLSVVVILTGPVGSSSDVRCLHRFRTASYPDGRATLNGPTPNLVDSEVTGPVSTRAINLLRAYPSGPQVAQRG